MDATGHSYLVPATDRQQARQQARLAMIAEGLAPGTDIHIGPDPDGSGMTEVVLTHRPLRETEGFLPNGQRFGNAGTRADTTGLIR